MQDGRIAGDGLRLSDAARTGLEKAFWNVLFQISNDSLEEMSRQFIARGNPLVAIDRNLSTRHQREDAALALKTQLESGQMVLPEELIRVIHDRLRLHADAYARMLRNISACREKISGNYSVAPVLNEQ